MNLPIEIIDKILLYNSHPLADIFKKSSYHIKWTSDLDMWSNMQKLCVDKQFPLYWRCKLPLVLCNEYRCIYSKFRTTSLFPSFLNAESDSDSDSDTD